MKIALTGYGAMGKLIRALAEEKGHMIAAVVDRRTSVPPMSDMLQLVVNIMDTQDDTTRNVTH